MALAQVDWSRLIELLLPGGIIGALGWWSGQKQGKVTEAQRQRELALQTEEAEGNRAFREADRVSKEWDSIQSYWTGELKAAREAAEAAQKIEDECVRRHRELWRWSVKLAGKWNHHHPTDTVEIPNGESP
jgi:hypothetical protein